MDSERLERCLDTLTGSREDFRRLLTDTEGMIRRLCQYAENEGLRREVEPWAVISRILGHGSGVSSAIYELYRRPEGGAT